MEERYEKLFEATKNLYVKGSPVIIEAGALLKDKLKSKIIGQLKIKNISNQTIKATKIKFVQYDISGKEIDKPFNYQYLDLDAKRNDEFGQKTAIPFPNNTARSFTVIVEEVIYSDNKTWKSKDNNWVELPSLTSLKTNLKEDELVKQYQIKNGKLCKYIPQTIYDLWICSCGNVNHENENKCYTCHNSLKSLEDTLNIKKLKKEKDERLKKEDENRKETQQKIKKIIKIASISIIIIAIIYISGKIIFSSIEKSKNYKEAVDLFENLEYGKAIELFEDLGDYKDSKEKKKEAEDILAKKDKEEQDKSNQDEYEKASALLDNGKATSAYEIFSKIKDYSNSLEMANEALTQSYIFDYPSNTSLNFWATNISKFKLITDTNKLKEIFTGTKYYRSMYGTYKKPGDELTFNSDGTATATKDNSIRHWSVSDDGYVYTHLLYDKAIDTSSTFDRKEVWELMDGAYLLVNRAEQSNTKNTPEYLLIDSDSNCAKRLIKHCEEN